MAKSFKSLLGDDIKSTRTTLHEAIPMTGSILTGTYLDDGVSTNVKTFSHGMFTSVYDYPYLSSSANHVIDLTFGISSGMSSSLNAQNAKKLNMYNSMAQVLLGYDTGSQIRRFDSNGNYADATGRMNHCFFLNFSRLLVKDEIKKNTFRMGMLNSGTVQGPTNNLTLGDYKSATEYRTSPAGDFGLIFTNSAGATANNDAAIGLIFYQAGIVVLSSSLFTQEMGPRSNTFTSTAESLTGMMHAQISGTIDQLADGFRNRIYNIAFNNTIELNSTIYFCRVNHNEYNYSSNPTYLSGSRLVVKNNALDLPISYITTVGLYSPDNELMAVAKLSEPIRKDPNTELTLRVRLDY